VQRRGEPVEGLAGEGAGLVWRAEAPDGRRSRLLALCVKDQGATRQCCRGPGRLVGEPGEVLRQLFSPSLFEAENKLPRRNSRLRGSSLRNRSI
jgi:hypothetical protein